MLLLLFLGSICSGTLNSIAGGGAFITFPLLVLAGATPLQANATSTVATFPGLLAAMLAYRSEWGTTSVYHRRYALPSFIGGVIGAVLLVSTGSVGFARMVPYLLLFSTLIFTFKERIRRVATQPGSHFGIANWAGFDWVCIFLTAIYGGYWGAGMGILILAVLGFLGLREIHQMNAVKTLSVILINLTGVFLFSYRGLVAWRFGLALALGSSLGGYFSGRLAKKINPKFLNIFVIGIATFLTAYFFYKAY
jgi:uncharacterized membrane protein YfcA